MTRINARPPPSVTAPKSEAHAAPTAAASSAPAAAPAGWRAGTGATAATAATAPASTAATPAQVANAFYTAFQTKDVAAMGKLYAPGTTFKDPIYDLKGKDATTHMWTSLFKAGTDLKLSYKVLDSSADSAKVSWTADYKVFGRPVHNESITELKVKDGQITQQQDNWSWSKWAKQALPLGPLVDFPPVKAAIRFLLQKA